MGHTITWTVDDGRIIHPRVTCTEPPEADCHLDMDCGCEEIGLVDADELGKYHNVDYGEGDVKHRMTPVPGKCNIKDWLENSDEVEEEATAPFDITVPFEPVWAGHFYQWKPLVTKVGP